MIAVQADAFAGVCAWAARHADPRSYLAAATGLRLHATGDALTVTAVGADVTATGTVACEVEKDLDVLVPATRLAALAARCEAPVSLSADGDEMTVKSGRKRFMLRCLPVDEFPATGDLDGDATPVDAAVWKALVGAVADAAAREENYLPPLLGVCLEAADGMVTLVATDKHRLHRASAPWTGPDFAPTVVPAGPLGSTVKLGGGKTDVAVSDRQARFAGADRRIVSRLLEGKYPAWRNLIPTGHELAVEVDAGALTAAIGDCMPVASLNLSAPIVDLHIDADGVTVKAATGQVGDAESPVEAAVDGPPLHIRFRAALLVDAIKAVDTERVRLELRNEMKPVTILPVDPDGGWERETLVMPVAI